jgi:hypothetical protein
MRFQPTTCRDASDGVAAARGKRLQSLHFSSDSTSHSIVHKSARHLSFTSMMDNNLTKRKRRRDGDKNRNGGNGSDDIGLGGLGAGVQDAQAERCAALLTSADGA